MWFKLQIQVVFNNRPSASSRSTIHSTGFHLYILDTSSGSVNPYIQNTCFPNILRIQNQDMYFFRISSIIPCQKLSPCLVILIVKLQYLLNFANVTTISPSEFFSSTFIIYQLDNYIKKLVGPECNKILFY